MPTMRGPVGSRRTRLFGDGSSSALLRPLGEVDWWCAPDRLITAAVVLLDANGAAAR